MDYSSDILNYLAAQEQPQVILLAPNAPPVTRSATGVDIALPMVLDATAVSDTLLSLRTRALPVSQASPLSPSGTFAFGIPNVGRIRVSYATQRGSKIVSITKVPFQIPPLGTLTNAPAIQDRLIPLLASNPMGLLIVSGPRAISNAMLVYSLLQEINKTKRKILFLLERRLTFLISHAESIVIQAELVDDVPTLNEGVENALLFDPDILFVGDLREDDELPALRHAVSSGILAIISTTVMDYDKLQAEYMPPPQQSMGRRFIRGKILVQPVGANRLSVEYIDLTPKII